MKNRILGAHMRTCTHSTTHIEYMHFWLNSYTHKHTALHIHWIALQTFMCDLNLFWKRETKPKQIESNMIVFKKLDEEWNAIFRWSITICNRNMKRHLPHWCCSNVRSLRRDAHCTLTKHTYYIHTHKQTLAHTHLFLFCFTCKTVLLLSIFSFFCRLDGTYTILLLYKMLHYDYYL